jgi:hypothetical protein
MHIGEVSAKVADVAGVVGIVAGVVGIASAARQRRAFALGIVALALAFVAAAAGVLGTDADRRATDRDAAEIAVRGSRQIALHDGYLSAQSRASRGARDATLPLVLGALAAFLGTRKTESPLRRRTTAAAACVALLTTGGAWAAARSRIPPFIAHETVELLDARDRIDTDLALGCRELESSAQSRWHPADRKEWPRHFAPDPRADVPDFDMVATRCLQKKFTEAHGSRGVDDLLESPLLVDDDLRAALRAYMPPCTFACGFSDDPDDDGYGHIGLMPIVRLGAPTTSSHIPTDMLPRFVALHIDQIKRCYGAALVKDATIRFRTSVKLTVGREAHVTSAALEPNRSDELSKCVLGVVRTMRFFSPEDASFTVDFPLTFDAH